MQSIKYPSEMVTRYSKVLVRTRIAVKSSYGSKSRTVFKAWIMIGRIVRVCSIVVALSRLVRNGLLSGVEMTIPITDLFVIIRSMRALVSRGFSSKWCGTCCDMLSENPCEQLLRLDYSDWKLLTKLEIWILHFVALNFEMTKSHRYNLQFRKHLIYVDPR